jgi:hypothetical protein
MTRTPNTPDRRELAELFNAHRYGITYRQGIGHVPQCHCGARTDSFSQTWHGLHVADVLLDFMSDDAGKDAT